MTKRVSEKTAARIKKIRDNEGLCWSTIGERFGIAGCTARAAYERAGKRPNWHSAATRVGVSIEEYTARRAAGLQPCSRCHQWFERESPEFRANRFGCAACLHRDDAKARARLTDEQKAQRAAATQQRRAERTAERDRQLQAELHQTLRAYYGGAPFRAANAAKLTPYSHVTIGARLRKLQARGLVERTADGWRVV